MAVKGDILRKILTDLRSRPGASLQDLAYTLPPNYLHMDFDSTYLVFESMLVLMRWGLVEAYDGKRVLNVKDLEGYSRYDWPRDLTFYITKQTTEMEEALGIRLDASAEKIFGETRPGNWPQVLVVMPFADSLRPLYEDHMG